MSEPLTDVVYAEGVTGHASPLAEVNAESGAPTALGTKRFGWAGWVSLVWIVLMVLLAIFCSVLPFSKHIGSNEVLTFDLGPFKNSAHILGSDGSGRDLLAITLYGTRASMIVGFVSIIGAFIVGGTLGLLAGFTRGRIETLFTSVFDIVLAFPALILALALVVFLRGTALHPSPIPPILIVVIALGVVGVPILGRITRASTLTWAERDFVLAAKAQGATARRIILRELLPNVLPAMASLATLSVAVAIVAEGGLSILGAGVPPSTPSWGNVIASGQNEFTNGDPYIVIIPSIFMFLTVLALNYLGDAVRERFDVRESAL